MPGSPAHLFTRFFDVATAKRLTDSERTAVSVWLKPDVKEVFFAQSHADQRHGYHAARSVISSGINDEEVIMAALLHDVGKRHARLGLIGRTVASLLILFRLPLGFRMSLYRDHGIVGARELGALGVPSVVVDFAIHHHGGRPPTIPAEIWDVLVASDKAPKARTWLLPGIISGLT